MHGNLQNAVHAYILLKNESFLSPGSKCFILHDGRSRCQMEFQKTGRLERGPFSARNGHKTRLLPQFAERFPIYFRQVDIWAIDGNSPADHRSGVYWPLRGYANVVLHSQAL